jgi:hypothetical protein
LPVLAAGRLHGVDVTCGETLRLVVVQPEGRPAMARAWRNGARQC